MSMVLKRATLAFVITYGAVAGCATASPPARLATNNTRVAIEPPFPATDLRLYFGRGYFSIERQYYPELPHRLKEVGATKVRVCVDPDGLLTRRPAVVKSSGSSRLDAAAIEFSGAMSGHWAAMRNGIRVAACTNVQLPMPPPPSMRTEAHVSILSMDKGFPSLEAYYPTTSRRLGEQGTALVRICASPNGRLAQAPTMVRSSGSPRLDAAAIRFADATSGHWVVRRSDGRPTGSACSVLPVRFTLTPPLGH